MDAEYAAAYRDLSLRHWWFRARRDLVLTTLAAEAPPEGYGSILDVGCGDGLFFDDLRRWGEPSGVEPDGAIVTDHGRRAGTIHVTTFDEEFRPGERYGLILMLDVLEHLDDDVAALRQVRELLAPGGLFVVTVPALRCLWTHHDEVNHHRLRYRRRELARAVTAAGLRLRRRPRYFFHWLVPLKLAIRTKERLLGIGNGVPRIPPRPINSAFYLASRAEQALSRRLPLPLLGSSILAVAERPC